MNQYKHFLKLAREEASTKFEKASNRCVDVELKPQFAFAGGSVIERYSDKPVPFSLPVPPCSLCRLSNLRGQHGCPVRREAYALLDQYDE